MDAPVSLAVKVAAPVDFQAGYATGIRALAGGAVIGDGFKMVQRRCSRASVARAAFLALATAALRKEPRFNQLQVIGSHNSYHVAPAKGVREMIVSRNAQPGQVARLHPSPAGRAILEVWGSGRSSWMFTPIPKVVCSQSRPPGRSCTGLARTRAKTLIAGGVLGKPGAQDPARA